MKFNEELSKAKTIREVFDAVNKHYNTDEPLTYVKGLLIKQGLIKAIDTIQPAKR